MTSIIRNLINRLYSGGNRYPTVTILGLGGSGKTTMLYLLKLGEIVTTIPSIGFNVETIDVRTSSKKTLGMTAWDIGTGCGIQYLYGLLKIYITQSTALIWVVDASDRSEYFAESVDSLKQILREDTADKDSEKIPPNLPILILANKSDKPNAMSVDEIRINFSKVTAGRLVAVFRTSFTQEKGVTSSGLPEAFDWLHLAMEISKSGKPIELQQDILKQPSDPRDKTTLAHKLASWLTRIEADSAPDEFLEKFHTLSLPSWDHYTHIRIAYLLLTKHGRQEGKDMIFKGLERYISLSQQTKGKSFHFTMTYFWIQIIHFGIRNTPPLPQLTQTTVVQPTPESTSVTSTDFARFLLVNPHVADGNLWADYYTKGVIMTPKAKEEMVLPDRKPLPNLVIRDAITTLGGHK